MLHDVIMLIDYETKFANCMSKKGKQFKYFNALRHNNPAPGPSPGGAPRAALEFDERIGYLDRVAAVIWTCVVNYRTDNSIEHRPYTYI